MRIIIYGIGKICYDIFNNPQCLELEIIKKDTEIIGFADSNSSIWGKEFLYNGHKYMVKGIDSFCVSDFDGIFITTEKYYEEIKRYLIESGYKDKQIFGVRQFIGKYLDKVYGIQKFKKKKGIEIGGPTELFYNIYDRCAACDNVNFSSSTVWWENSTNDFRYKNKIMGNVFIAEATDMHQIKDEKYDFILSSNNLEHIANPLKALEEFARLVRKKGIVLVLVPIKDKTFDHNREYTTFKHLLEDYKNNVGEDDLSHLPEIIERHDYDMDVPCGGREKFIERAKKNIENRCLHHHVFDEECLRKAFEFCGIETIMFSEITNNWLIMGEKQ